MIKNVWDLKRIRHSRVIEDPFPEHSSYQMLIQSVHTSTFEKLFGKSVSIPKPDDISIHKAYRLGYEQAYREIEAALPVD